MQPVLTFSELSRRLAGRRTAATIGVFDGVHLGHQALVRQTVDLARHLGDVAVAITFSNHPLSVLAPPYLPRNLITPARKADLLFQAGIDEVLMLEFTPELAARQPEEFVHQNLLNLAGVRNLVCGYDFSFGCKGSGNVELLREQGAELGFSVYCLDPVATGDQIVKSTHIRDLLTTGRVRRAAELLTRPHELPGRIVTGFQRGRTIGFPTANLQPPEHYQWPAIGVYLCAARLAGEEKLWPAMVNVGKNPTFGETDPTVEAHILDFSGDITGQTMALYFLDRLRNEQKFSGVDELVAQLGRDREATIAAWSTEAVRHQIASIPRPL